MLFFSGLSEQAGRHAARIWAMRRVQGELLSVLRLVKASATFSGGIEYLAWKISRSEEHTSELQSLMRISYAVFCLKKKTKENLRNKPSDKSATSNTTTRRNEQYRCRSKKVTK